MTTGGRELRDRFEEQFGPPPDLQSWASGRVNLIGEHTDHQGGWVLPTPTRSGVQALGRHRSEPRVRIRSTLFDELLELDPRQPEPAGDWGDLLRGGIAALREVLGDAPRGGADLLLGSDLPAGKGLSSSAATSIATLPLLARALWPGRPALPRDRLPGIARRAEALGCGVHCGIMDPYVIVHGDPGAALLIDCEAETHTRIPLDLAASQPPCALGLIESGVTRRLRDGGYERIFRWLQEATARVGPLRRVSRLPRKRLPGEALAHARHVVEENARTLVAAASLRSGDLVGFGRHLTASHHSLRDLLRATCAETDAIVASLTRLEGVLGARQVGGGFGGAVLFLARTDADEEIEETLGLLRGEDPFPRRMTGVW